MDLLEGQLTKLTIDVYEDMEYKTRVGRPWHAMFNPSQLAFGRSVRYNTIPAAGSSKPQVQYGGGDPDQLSVELFFDGTGVVESDETVRERTDRLIAITDFQRETHKACHLHLFWRDFHFRGVLEKLDIKYTLFARNGDPLRATATLSLKEALAPTEVAAKEGATSPDLYQTWLVSDGDTIDGIAERIYGSPAWWRPIAAANRLVNPRSLVAGQVLTLPPRLD